MRTHNRRWHERVSVEVFDDSIGLETRIEHNAVILTCKVRNVAILLERHRNDRAYLQLRSWHNKHPFHRKGPLTTIFPVGPACGTALYYPPGQRNCSLLACINASVAIERAHTARANGIVLQYPA